MSREKFKILSTHFLKLVVKIVTLDPIKKFQHRMEKHMI